MSPSKFSTLRQYTLLPCEPEALEEIHEAAKGKSYFDHHYKYRCVSFIFASLVVFYVAFHCIEIASILEADSSPLYGTDLELIDLENSANASVDYRKYLIYTPQCIISRIPVFDEQTKALYSYYKHREYRCPRADATAAIRRVNYTWVQVPKGWSCLARDILRDASTEGVKYGQTFDFHSQTTMNFPNSDAVEVRCRGIKPTRIIPLIPRKKPIWRNESQPLPNLLNRTNILAIGIDSISRLNYLRHFIETHKFVRAHHFDGPLYGLHKIGDNTFPNLIGMFTGIDSDTVQSSLPKSRKLDNVPLIFKSFSAAGYLTTYIENMPKFGLWTYHKKNGFTKQPIEYLMRPVNILVYNQLKNSFCYKDKLEMELYYDYILDQMRAFRERDQRFLTFIHMGAVTHDVFNYAQYADLPVLRLLKQIFDDNLHKDTLIIFYSDHGIRFGQILATESGYQESRMPFMFFHVPDSMRLKDASGMWMDSEAIRQVLRNNSRRLTSQFDVHATLRHILEQVPPQNELYGRSLFSPIPLNRTCENAGISDEYCLCKSFVAFTEVTSQSWLSAHIVDHLNEKLKPFTAKCAHLKLDRVLSTKMSFSSANNGTNKASKETFIVKILTQPNNGTIETTLQATVKNGRITDRESIQLTGNILRLDRYGEQSKCVTNTPVESFCYCRDLLVATVNS